MMITLLLPTGNSPTILNDNPTILWLTGKIYTSTHMIIYSGAIIHIYSGMISCSAAVKPLSYGRPCQL